MVRRKKVGPFFIEDVWFDTTEYNRSKSLLKALHTNEVLKKELFDLRIVGKTLLLDITREESDIMSGFEYKSCRYPINKAIKDGVKVYKVDNEAEMKSYLDYQKGFCKKKGIPVVTDKDIEGLDVYCAMSKEGEFLGGCAFLKSSDNKLVRYKYGATEHKLNANEAILWKAIRDYKSQEFEAFDFGGCIPTEDKNDYFYRHYKFKKKFGGELIDSYTYFKMNGLYKLIYFPFKYILLWFFKDDMNEMTIWLNKRGLIK